MASTSEKGHAKNIANLNLLNNHIEALGNTYQPLNPEIVLSTLKSLYETANALQQEVNTLAAPYTMAVDEREAVFRPLNRELTKLRKVYKATQGVTLAQQEDLMTIIRKLKGERKSKALTTSEHSVAQLSYDQRTNHMGLLISLLRNTPNYSPNEQQYAVQTFEDKKAMMLQTTQAIANTYIPFNNARSTRNHTLYGEDKLVDVANKAKDYLYAILDTNSEQYKAIGRIKFRKD